MRVIKSKNEKPAFLLHKNMFGLFNGKRVNFLFKLTYLIKINCAISALQHRSFLVVAPSEH